MTKTKEYILKPYANENRIKTTKHRKINKKTLKCSKLL